MDAVAPARVPKRVETMLSPAAATISRSPAAKATGFSAVGLAATQAAITTAITEPAETKMPTLAVSPMQTVSATGIASYERLVKRAGVPASISPTVRTVAGRPRMARLAATALACLPVAQTANRYAKAVKVVGPADLEAKAKAIAVEDGVATA